MEEILVSRVRITSYNEVGTIFNIRLVNYSRPVHYPSRIEIELYLIIFARDSLHTRATMRIRIVYSYIFIIYDCQCPSQLPSSRTIIKIAATKSKSPPPLPSFPFFSLFLFSFFYFILWSLSHSIQDATGYLRLSGVRIAIDIADATLLYDDGKSFFAVKLAVSTSNYYYHYYYTCITRIRGDNAI